MDLTTQFDTRPLATPTEFCEYAGVTKGHAAQMRYAGTGPKFVKITGRQVRYRWSDIEEWLDSRTRNRTDDPPAPRARPTTPPVGRSTLSTRRPAKT